MVIWLRYIERKKLCEKNFQPQVKNIEEGGGGLSNNLQVCMCVCVLEWRRQQQLILCLAAQVESRSFSFFNEPPLSHHPLILLEETTSILHTHAHTYRNT